MPIVSQIPGFQEYLFVDAGDGAHLTISLYDDPSGAEQSTRDAAGWVRIHIDARRNRGGHTIDVESQLARLPIATAVRAKT